MQMWRETEATMTPDELPDLVQQVVDEIWTRGDLELADRLFTPEYTNHGGLIPDLVHGPEAIKVSVAMYRLAFPGLRIVVDDLMVDGDTATFRWEAHADRAALPADGEGRASRGTLRGTTVIRMRADQIAESWMSWDAEGAVQQLRPDLTRAAPSATFAA